MLFKFRPLVYASGDEFAPETFELIPRPEENRHNEYLDRNSGEDLNDITDETTNFGELD